ncbi:MAG: helix-turn-helix transcriptional regulator [Clostridia bacterium]|nr:helix-turn-helix transcriptional regulator [Clostridia bacterium]
MTPMEFLENERIFHAKQMLRNSDAPVTDISMKVGYNSPAYFTSVFRKAVGKTPSEYRRVLGYERF